MKVAAVLLLFVASVHCCDETNPVNDFCYAELDLKAGTRSEYTCRCPWSNCEQSGSSYSCKLTGVSIALLVVGSLLICLCIAGCIFCCVKQGKCCCYAENDPVNTTPDAQVPVQGVPVAMAIQPQAQQPAQQGDITV